MAAQFDFSRHAFSFIDNHESSIGIRVKNGIVVATETVGSILADIEARAEKISRHNGCVYAGLATDYAALVKSARHAAVMHHLEHDEPMSVFKLVARIGAEMKRRAEPYTSPMLVAGWDVKGRRPMLFNCRPDGEYFSCDYTALGKHEKKAKAYLEKRHDECTENLDDAVRIAMLTLRDACAIALNEESVEMAVCDATGFRTLTKKQLLEHIGNL